jgi:RNA polymerase sigma-70 factor (ECF subfamily)
MGKGMSSSGASTDEIEAVYRERFRPFLLTVTAFLRDGDAALDVVQEAFALALRRRRSFRGEGSVQAWLWRIVLNVARDRARSRRRQEDVLRERETTAAPSGADPELRALVLALPERQRLAVFLRYYADLSYEQIAEALGIRPGTVAASLNAAHVALRHDLEEVPR